MFDSAILNKIEKIEVWGEISLGAKLELTTDSRNIVNQNVFLAIQGEKFDGFLYLEQAIKSGCQYLVYNAIPERKQIIQTLYSKNPQATFIGVKDSVVALQEIASLHRIAWGKTVIGITGSNGKTTTKEILSYLLKKIFPDKVLATQGNLNNHIGVPLTLLKLCDQHEYAIVEMGTNHIGEIERLCEIAKPNAGIITNIGESHLEFLENREGVFQEKSMLYKAVVSSSHRNGPGIFILNYDDPYLCRLPQKDGVITIGEHEGQYQYHFTNSHQVEVQGGNEQYILNNEKIFGKFNLKNLIHAFLLIKSICPEKIKELMLAIEEVELPKNNRSAWIKQNHLNIFADAYNANPSSMKASLGAFNEYIVEQMIDKNKCFIVLGDMNELGGASGKFHEEIGIYLSQLDFKHVAFIGRFGSEYQKGYGTSHVFKSTRDFSEFWIQNQKKYDYLYLKGSRTLQLESIIDITK